MRIAIWETNHPISQTVCKSLAKGFKADLFNTSQLNAERLGQYDAHIAYGILRGAAEVFKACDKLNKPWFNVDNGYTSPSHYDGNYRISFRGTQARYHEGIEYASGHPISIRPHRDGHHTLIVPPSKHVCEFFGIDPVRWLFTATNQNRPYKIRWKNDTEELDLSQVHHVHTFNSSIGWKALLQGISVTSDPLHSVVGSFLATKCIDFSKNPVIDIKPLVCLMNEHQFTLREIENGAAWGLIERYLKSS